MALIALLTMSPLLCSVRLWQCKTCLHKDGFKKMKLMCKGIFYCSRKSPQSSPKADLWGFPAPSSQGTLLCILYLRISLCHADEYVHLLYLFFFSFLKVEGRWRNSFPWMDQQKMCLQWVITLSSAGLNTPFGNVFCKIVFIRKFIWQSALWELILKLSGVWPWTAHFLFLI